MFKKYKKLKSSFYRLIYRKNIFDSLIEEERTINLKLTFNEIVLGYENATNVITCVINPYCNACAAEFNNIKNLLILKPNSFKIVIRFMNDYSIYSDLQNVTSIYLTNCYYTYGKNKFMEILTKWFNSKDLKQFSKKYKTHYHKKANDLILKNLEWTDEIEITETPCVFLGNKRLPSYYSLDSLINLI